MEKVVIVKRGENDFSVNDTGTFSATNALSFAGDLLGVATCIYCGKPEPEPIIKIVPPETAPETECRCSKTAYQKAYQDGFKHAYDTAWANAAHDYTEMDTLQKDITQWLNYNFASTRDELTAVVGLVEEVGELCRAVVKRRQDIRGTTQEWEAEIRKEIGDIFIKLVDVAAFYNLSLSQTVWNRWAVIQQRDWVKDNKGQGIPK